MKLLTNKNRQEMENGKKKMKSVDKKDMPKTKAKPLTKTAAVESLMTTVQGAMQQVADTNLKTVSLIEAMVVHLERDVPAPVLQIDSPIVQMPEMPEVPVVQPIVHLKVKVTKRDNFKLIDELDIWRVE